MPIAPQRTNYHLEEVAGDALDCVVDGKNMDTLAVLDIGAGLHHNHVAEANAQVLAHRLVHADFALFNSLIRKNDANSVLALLSLDKNGVTAEQAEFLHSVEMQSNNAVVVIGSFIHNQAIWVLLLQRRCCCTTLSVDSTAKPCISKELRTNGSKILPNTMTRCQKGIFVFTCYHLAPNEEESNVCLLLHLEFLAIHLHFSRKFILAR
jgi:hypothetical protein